MNYNITEEEFKAISDNTTYLDKLFMQPDVTLPRHLETNFVPLPIAFNFIEYAEFHSEETDPPDLDDTIYTLIPDSHAKFSMNVNQLIRCLILENEISTAMYVNWMALLQQLEKNRLLIRGNGDVALMNREQPPLLPKVRELLLSLKTGLICAYNGKFDNRQCEALESRLVSTMLIGEGDESLSVCCKLKSVFVDDKVIVPRVTDLINWVNTANLFLVLVREGGMFTREQLLKFIFGIHTIIRGMKVQLWDNVGTFNHIDRAIGVLPNYEVEVLHEGKKFLQNPVQSKYIRGAFAIWIIALLIEEEEDEDEQENVEEDDDVER